MEKYIVRSVKQETADVMSIFFTKIDGSKPDYVPGQFITVNFPDLGTPEGKAYSLSSVPAEETLSIAVKRIGTYSHRLCDLKQGDAFNGSVPYGFLFEDIGRPLVCIAAGVGISPLWSVMKSVLASSPDRQVSLLLSSKDRDSIVFSDAINQLRSAHDGFTVSHFITQEGVLDKNGYVGHRIGLDDMTQIYSSNKQSDYLLCGSQEFVIDMYQHLSKVGVADNQISTEIFFQ